MENLSGKSASSGNNGDPPPEHVQLRSHLECLDFDAGQCNFLFSKQSF